MLMNELLVTYLNKMLKYEEKGCINEAMILCDKLLETFPENAEDILTEKAKLEFRNMREKAALLDFIRAYEINRNIDLYELILEAYLNPNLEELDRRYKENMHILSSYHFYFNDYDENDLCVFALWQDEELICIVDINEKTFSIVVKGKLAELEAGEREILVINALSINEAEYFKDKVKKSESAAIIGAEVPCYLFFDYNIWMAFAQLDDITPLVTVEKVVLLVGEKSLRKYFEDEMTIMPSMVYRREGKEYVVSVIESIWEQKRKRFEDYNKEITKYYAEHKDEILMRIQRGIPRILFMTSRFTTALQYHTRDCVIASKNVGCEVDFVIENNDFQGISDLEYIKRICKFKPDIIFCIDHFRYEFYKIPDEIVYITWVQDLLPSTTNREILNKLDNRDIIANMFFSDLRGRLWKVNYDNAVRFPICSNLQIYKKYDLTMEEKEKYECDICIVANASDYETSVEDFLKDLTEIVKDQCRMVIECYFELMQEECFFYWEQNKAIVENIIKHFDFLWFPALIDHMVEYLSNSGYYRRYKSLVAEWLVEAGYENIKLYGNEWHKNEKLRPYAQGIIQNGEELSKALNAAKVTIGLHPHISLPARALETIASGSLYLAHDIPGEYDMANAREYFVENKEIIYYYNKEDLLNKIDYYLLHPDKRNEIIEAGRRKISDKLTYEKTLSQLFQEIYGLLNESENNN